MKNKQSFLYGGESHKIIGLAFDVFNEVGHGHKEVFYQRALAQAFRESGIEFKEQVKAVVFYKGKKLGYYIFDFLVFGKIVLEIKKRNYFSKKDIEQLYSYLKASNLKLGILIHFTNQGVKIKRVVNLY